MTSPTRTDDGLTHLTPAQAEVALRKAAFTIGEEDEGAGRVIVHCMMSFTGADWDLDSALALLPTARDIVWIDDIFGHELAVMSENGTTHRFQATQAEHGKTAA